MANFEQPDHLTGQSIKEDSRTKKTDVSEFYKRVSTLCFFFEVSEQKQFIELIKWVASEHKKHKKLQVLVFSKIKLILPKKMPHNVMIFDKHDFTIFNSTKTSIKRWMTSHAFDLLVVFTTGLNNKSKHLIRGINAKSKIGPKTDEDKLFYYQVNIKYDKDMAWADFYRWAQNYYLQLNINT